VSRDRPFARDFVLLWQGQLVSQLGSQAFVVAVMYWTMETTGSASLMAGLMIAATLPGIILGPVGGAIADRHGRKLIIVAGDAVRGAAMLLVAWTASAHAANPDHVIAALLIVSLLSGTIGAVFNPAVAATIPDLVPVERLTAANSLAQLSGQAALILGQVAGGVLYRLLGAPILFLIDGVSFLISAASEAWIRIPAPAPRDDPASAMASYLADAREGLRFVWSQSGMRAFIFTTTTLNFVFMPVFVLLPFYVRDNLGSGPAWYGFLLAALSAGSMLGIACAGVLRLTGERRARTLRLAFVCLPLVILAVAATSSPALALLLLFATGMFTGLINVFVLTLVQLTSPPAMRARALAVVLALAHAAMPMGMALGGAAADLGGAGVTTIFAACGLAGVSVSAYMLRSAPLRVLMAHP
jgi:MFS transporter, DHA3 family, macrolide efflux protein